ncbi:MAG: hypothetical protein WCK98_01155 [bacterium]
MAFNQNQKKMTVSKVFTWILAGVVLVSILAGAVSSFLLKPANKANASQISSSRLKTPLPNGIEQSSSSNGSLKPLPKSQAPGV